MLRNHMVYTYLHANGGLTAIMAFYNIQFRLLNLQILEDIDCLNIFIHINENKHINEQYITMVYDGIQRETIRLLRICSRE